MEKIEEKNITKKQTDNFSEPVHLLRGIAILAVISIHVSAIFTSLTPKGNTYQLYVLINALSNFAVPLFIFISGYGLTKRYFGQKMEGSVGDFYVRRLSKILPSYFVFSLLYIIIFPNLTAMSLPGLAKTLATGGAYYHFWYIIILIQLYLLFPFILKLYKKFFINKPIVFLLLSFIIQISWMSLLFTGLNVAWAFHGFFFPAQIMFFCLGMVFATNEGRIDITLDKSLSVVTLIATTVLFVPIQYLLEVRAMPLFGDFYNMTNSYSAMIRISGSLLWASIIILLFKYRFLLYSWGPVRKIFSPLAKNSYYIYLIHPMVLSFAIQFSSQHRFLSTNHFYYPLMMLFVTGVSLVIAVLITSGRNYIRAHK